MDVEVDLCVHRDVGWITQNLDQARLESITSKGWRLVNKDSREDHHQHEDAR